MVSGSREGSVDYPSIEQLFHMMMEDIEEKRKKSKTIVVRIPQTTVEHPSRIVWTS